MSFLKGKFGRSVAVVSFMMVAMALVGATPASAVSTCSYLSGALTVTSDDPGAVIGFQQNSDGQVFVTGTAACTGGPILAVNLTTVSVSGGTDNQQVNIWMSSTGLPTAPVKKVSWGKVNWTVSLGTDLGAPTAQDGLLIYDAGPARSDALDLAMGANGIDLNNDGDLDVTVSGIENYRVQSDSPGKDMINAGGSTITGAAFPQAIAGYLVGPFVAPFFGIVANVDTVSCRALGLPTDCGDKSLTGGAGADRIQAIGPNGYQTVAPGAGDDFADLAYGNADYSASPTAINANLPGNTINGWGLDTFTPSLGVGFGVLDVVGSAQGDILLGRPAEYNYFIPGAGNDTVTGGDTAATVPPGGENDAYDVSDAETGVTVDLTKGTSTGGSGTDTLVGIEDVYGTESDDTITGTDSTSVPNYIRGAGGNDTLAGGAASGNTGSDYLDGGDGIDVVNYGANSAGTNVNLAQNTACTYGFSDFDPTDPPAAPANSTSCGASVSVASGVPVTSGVSGEKDVLLNVENAILGTGNDTFNGSAFNNTVWPNGGQNTLSGCAPVSTFQAQGCGIDTVNYSQGYKAGVTVNLAGGGPSGGNADSVVGFANAVGTAFNDTIIGSNESIGNSLKGGKGADELSGNNGPDFILGGAGADNIRGGGSDDTLRGGDANDTIRGSGGDDNIYGQKGKDRCNGGNGVNVVKCEKKLKGKSARANVARLVVGKI
jgi:Ca2+-binding RTX toxin-like protein